MAALVRDLMIPGVDVRVGADLFAVRACRVRSSERRHSGTETTPVLFWVHEQRGLNGAPRTQWSPATWPGNAASIEFADAAQHGRLRDYLSRFGPRVYDVERAEGAVVNAAPQLIRTCLEAEAASTSGYRDLFSSSPIEATRRAGAALALTPPAIAAGASVAETRRTIETWRSATVSAAEALIDDQGAVTAQWLHHSLGSGGERYARARALGYDIQSFAIAYSAPGTLRDRDVPTALLTRNNRPVEAPQSLLANGLRLKTTWTVAAADARALIRDAAAIMNGAVPQAGREGEGL